MSGDSSTQLELPSGGRFVASVDIDAKADEALTPGKVPPQLRALLAERFQLTLHREMKEMPVYALTVARADRQLGPRLQVASVDGCAEAAAARGRGAVGAAAAPATPSPCVFRVFGGALVARSMRVGILSSRLPSEVGRFVIDKTGLAGLYDYDMTWAPDAGAAPADASRPSLFTALQEQLGLKLESQRALVDVTVIDRVEHLIPN